MVDKIIWFYYFFVGFLNEVIFVREKLIYNYRKREY